jgi:hypothetical protein
MKVMAGGRRQGVEFGAVMGHLEWKTYRPICLPIEGVLYRPVYLKISPERRRRP